MRLSFILVFIVTAAHSQFRYARDGSIPVRDENDRELSMPWAGGLNAAQYNMMDLDGDDDEDLVIYDRTAGKLVTFLWQGTRYHYAPDFETLFPEEITNFLLLRDFNCDGRKDIFTSDPGGIRVFKNSTANGILQWEPFLFSAVPGGTKTTALLTKGLVNKVNLQIAFDDMPAISDVDGDGDLDIFSMQYFGNGNIEYHQNFSKERYGTCDSLEFERVTRNWGNVLECHCDEFAFNGSACDHSGGRTKHTVGKSLFSMDINADQKADLLLSEAECPSIYQLVNEGISSADAQVNGAQRFPQNDPAFLLIYPAAYGEDVDHDGKRDIMITPNTYSKEFSAVDYSRSNLFYKNVGTIDNPSFTLEQRDYLQRDMIDLGDNSVPAFFDYDGDGDQDLFVGSNTSSTFNTSIYVFENIGSRLEPSFRLFTKDLFQLSFQGLRNIKVYFSDIDRSGTTDLIFTATNNFNTRVYYLTNKSDRALDVDLVVQALNFQITSQDNLAFHDINGDGSMDILVGKGSGTLEYWRNNGNLTFTQQTNQYLGITPSAFSHMLSCAVADLDANGSPDLILSGVQGNIRVVPDFKNATLPVEPLEKVVFDSLQKAYTAQNLGGTIWPTAAYLFDSPRPAIVVGSLLGGLQVLRNTSEFSFSPNLVKRNETVSLKVDELTTLYIYSATGRLISEPVSLSADEVQNYRVPALAAGMYIFRFVSPYKTRVEKIVIR